MRSHRVFGVLYVLGLAAMGCQGPAEAVDTKSTDVSTVVPREPPPEKVRLEDYFSAEIEHRTPVKDTDFRLRHLIARVPMLAMAVAHEEDTGADPKFWRKRLEAWDKAGVMEPVVPQQPYQGVEDLKDNIESPSPYAQPYRFISVCGAGLFWASMQYGREEPTDAVDENELLNYISEQPVGSLFKGRVSFSLGGKAADLDLKLDYTPSPTKRPAHTWPITPFKVDRVMFRPWKLEIKGRFPLHEVVFFGAQMEAPNPGEVHTGHVLAAFGCIYPPTKPPAPASQTIDPAPGVRVQTWTLSVPVKVALPWIGHRQPGSGDSKILHQWLADVSSKNEAKLLATAAVSTRSGWPSAVSSSLEWEDAWGFESSGTVADWRPVPCEVNRYSLNHALEATVQCEPERLAERTYPGDAAVFAPAFWRTQLASTRPTTPTRWRKWKIAMERDESDPDALEVGETGFEQRDNVLECIQSGFSANAGQITLSGSVLDGDNVHVTFQRVIEDAATRTVAPSGPATAAPSPPLLATWIIETPMTWQSRLLKADTASMTTLGAELLAAVDRGEARLAGHSCTTRNARCTAPCIFPDGPLDLFPSTRGVFLKPRFFGFRGLGDSMGNPQYDHLMWDDIPVHHLGEGFLPLRFKWLGAPEWRHWGVWQPSIKTTHAENSALDQPVFPHCELDGDWIIEPGRTAVIAALRMSEPYRIAPNDARLRWYVARLDGQEKKPPLDAESLAHFGRDEPSWQALVLRSSKDESLPLNRATALRLLDEAGTGKREVLELITLRDTGSVKAMLGSELHFTNGRDVGVEARETPPAKDEDMAPKLEHHVVGFGFEFDAEKNRWKIERDEKAPMIVTDTFRHDLEIVPTKTRVDPMAPRPETEVSMQRPIFSIARLEFNAALPKSGEVLIRPLSKTSVLVVRRLAMP